MGELKWESGLDPSGVATDATTYATLVFLLRGGQAVLVRGGQAALVRGGQGVPLREAEGLWGGGEWNAPGGKLQSGEDPSEGAAREVREKTGLAVLDLNLRGLLRFFFGKGRRPSRTVYVFTSHAFDGELSPGAEGILRWHPLAEIGHMWADGRYWVPRLLAGERFVGELWFDADTHRLQFHRFKPLDGRTGFVYRLNTSPSGVPKRPVFWAELGPTRLSGDGHHDTRHHGGPERALCLFSLEVIDRLRAEGHPITPGSTGENLTVFGVDWGLVRPGTVLQVGEAEIQVTGYTTPCRAIRGSFRGGDFRRIHAARHPGDSRVYARVLRGGVLHAGDGVEPVVTGLATAR